MTPRRIVAPLVTALALMGCCQDPDDPMCGLAAPEPDGGCWSAATEPIATHTTTAGPAELHIDGCAHMQADYCAAGPLVADPAYWLAPEARHIPAGHWTATAQSTGCPGADCRRQISTARLRFRDAADPWRP